MGDVPFLGSITCPGSMGLISASRSSSASTPSYRNRQHFKFAAAKIVYLERFCNFFVVYFAI